MIGTVITENYKECLHPRHHHESMFSYILNIFIVDIMANQDEVLTEALQRMASS